MVERTITTMSIAARTRTVNFWTFVRRDSKVNRSAPFDGRRCNHIRQVFGVMSVSGWDSLGESRLFGRGRSTFRRRDERLRLMRVGEDSRLRDEINLT